MLELLIPRIRRPLDVVPPPGVTCFYGNPLASLEGDSLQFPTTPLARAVGVDYLWHRLAAQSWTEDLQADTFMWLGTKVPRRIFVLWCLFEFSSFIRDPLDSHAESRLLAVASRRGDSWPELSMNFAKSVWEGYYELVCRSMQSARLDWKEVCDFPAFRGVDGTAYRPVERWPADEEKWTDFVEQRGANSMWLDDPRLRIRQLVQLVRPSRTAGSRIQSLGRWFLDPDMVPLRPLKDGFKGTARNRPVLALLIAASAGDNFFMRAAGELSNYARPDALELPMLPVAQANGPSFEDLVARWRDLNSHLSAGTSRRLTRGATMILCRLRCHLDPERRFHFVATGAIQHWLPRDGRAVPVVVLVRSGGREQAPQRALAYEVDDVSTHEVAMTIEAYPDLEAGGSELWLGRFDPLDVLSNCYAFSVPYVGGEVLALAVEVEIPTDE